MRINGTLVLLQLDDEGSPKTLAYVESATFNASVDLAEAVDKDSGGFQTFVEGAGQRSATIDVNGNADFEYTDGNAHELLGYLTDRNNVDFVFAADADDANTPDSVLSIEGEALTNELSIEAPNEQAATLSGTLTVNGGWTINLST